VPNLATLETVSHDTPVGFNVAFVKYKPNQKQLDKNFKTVSRIAATAL
jgi:hypothetical protein